MAAQRQQLIPMVNPSGVAVGIEEKDAQAALENGYTVETPEERGLREYQTKSYGSVAEPLKAFGEHAASSATFGLSDAILSQSDEYRQARQARDATFKTAGLLGEAGGYLVPGIGEIKGAATAGKIAKVLGAPVSTVSRLAAKAGGATERLIAAGAPGATRRVASKLAGGAVAGSIEGAAMGAGQALSDASIHDKELTAELLLDHVRGGASIGGVMGAGLAGGIEALSATGKALHGVASKTPVLSDMLGGSRGIEGLAETKALAAGGFLGSDFKNVIKREGNEAPHRLGRRIIEETGYNDPGAVKQAFTHDVEGFAETANGKLREWGEKVGDVHRRLEEGANRIGTDEIVARVENNILSKLRQSNHQGDIDIAQALEHQMKPMYQALERAEGIKGAQQSVAQLSMGLSEMMNLSLVDETLALQAAAQMRSSLKEVRSQLRNAGLSDSIGELDTLSGLLRGVKPGKLDGFNYGLANRSLGRIDGKAALAAAEHGTPSMSFDDVWQLERRVGQDVKNWERTADPKQHAFRDYKNLLKSISAEQAEKTGLAAEYKAANAGYHDWKLITDVAEKRAGSLAGNRSVGLTDTIVGSQGLSAALAGNPLGVAASIAGVIGNKFLRSAAGDRLLATGLNRYANWRNVTQASQVAAKQLATRTRSTVETLPLKQKVLGLAPRVEQEYETQRKLMLDRAADHDRMVDTLVARLGDVREISPDLANATIQAGSRGLNYLQSVMPKEPGYPDLLAASRKSPLAAPESQQAAFLRVAKAVDKPTSILKRAKDGQLTQDEVDAVVASYPKMHQAMQTQIMDKVAEDAQRGRVPTYQKRLQLSMLARTALDASLRPDVIQAYQAAHAQMSAAPEGTPTSGPKLLTGSGRATKFANRRKSFTTTEA